MKFRVTNFIENKNDGYKFYLAKQIYNDGSYSKNEFKIYCDMELILYDKIYNSTDFKNFTIIPKSVIIK